MLPFTFYRTIHLDCPVFIWRHTPKSKTLDEVYLHPKANQKIEAFDKANQLVKDEVLSLPEE